MSFKKRYSDGPTVTRAQAHFFSACTIAMTVALFNKDLLLFVAFYPIVLEAYQTFKNKRFKPRDAVFDLVENFSGIVIGLLIVALYEKGIF